MSDESPATGDDNGLSRSRLEGADGGAAQAPDRGDGGASTNSVANGWLAVPTPPVPHFASTGMWVTTTGPIHFGQGGGGGGNGGAGVAIISSSLAGPWAGYGGVTQEKLERAFVPSEIVAWRAWKID